MLPEFYNQLVAMHGTIMVFLAVVPLSVGAFGNYLIPLQIGEPDMAFPRLNMASYWTYLAGGLVMLASFFVRGGAPNSGWTSYPPLADFATLGQTFWLIGMSLLIVSALFGSVNHDLDDRAAARASHRAPLEQGRDSQLWPAADACEAGRDSRRRAAPLVHADQDRRVGDRLLAVVRARTLPHARVLHHSNASRFRRLAREPTCGTLTPGWWFVVGR